MLPLTIMPKIEWREFLGLLLLITSTIWLHTFHLDWGLPNRQRSLRVFETEEQIQKLRPLLIQARERAYSNVRDVIIDVMEGLPSNGERISREMVYNGMRSQLMQPRSTDEQQIIASLSRWKASKKFWKLPMVLYGYVYMALVALALVVAHLLGYLTLTSDIAFYFLHPEHAAGIYIAARWVGALSNVCCTGILYWIGRRCFGWRVGLLAALLYSWNPLSVVNSHYVKPWSLATLCACGLLFFCVNIAQGSKRSSDYLGAGCSLGLLAGTTYIYCFAWLWIVFAAGFAARKGSTSSRAVPGDHMPPGAARKGIDVGWKLLALSAAVGAGLFFATNLHVLTDYGDFMRMARRYDQLGLNPSMLMRSLRQGFLTVPGIFFIPSLISVVFFARRFPQSMEAFLSTLVILSFLLFGLLTGHWIHHLLPLYPAMSLLVARSIETEMNTRSYRKAASWIILLAILISSLGSSRAWLKDSLTDNLSLTGDWIQQHITQGSSIAIPYGVPGVDCPPFPFLKYNLYSYSRFDVKPTPKTDYVLRTHLRIEGPAQPLQFNGKYQLVYSMPQRGFSYTSLPVPMKTMTPVSNVAVEIWKRQK